MEKNRVARMISVVAICIAVVGISIGFAAWSASLTIRSAKSTVQPGDEATSFANLLMFGTPNNEVVVNVLPKQYINPKYSLIGWE